MYLKKNVLSASLNSGRYRYTFYNIIEKINAHVIETGWSDYHKKILTFFKYFLIDWDLKLYVKGITNINFNSFNDNPT